MFSIWLSIMYWIEVYSYGGLVLFNKGLDLFSPLVESSLRLLVILLAVTDLSFRAPLVMANSGVGFYVRFNLQEIWPTPFRRPLLPTMVEYNVPLLRSPRLWSILLVETAILVVGSGEVLWRWSFLRQWMSSDARKMKNRI